MNIQPYIDAFPLPANRGILSDINKETTEKALAEAMKNPATVAGELVKRLLDPGAEGNDIQARHLMHTMAVRIPDYGRKVKGNQRAEFSLALVKSLSGNLPDRVKAFIIRQVQLCGGKEVVPAIGAFLTVGGIADDAAQALIAINEGSADQFRKALPKVKEDILLYQNVLHGLAALADKASKAHFLEALGHKDGEVQLLGLWGLTQLADSSTLDAFLAADGKQTGFARVKAGSLCLQLAEKLPKEKAAGIYLHLKKTRTAPQEKYLQEIVAAAL